MFCVGRGGGQASMLGRGCRMRDAKPLIPCENDQPPLTRYAFNYAAWQVIRIMCAEACGHDLIFGALLGCSDSMCGQNRTSQQTEMRGF